MDGLKGFPAFALLVAPFPLAMLDLGGDIGGDGFFDCWHHVVHHESIKSEIRREVNSRIQKVIHREQSSPMVKEGEGSLLVDPQPQLGWDLGIMIGMCVGFVGF